MISEYLNSRRRLIGAGLAGAGVALANACGGSSNNNSTAAKPTSGAATTATGPATAATARAATAAAAQPRKGGSIKGGMVLDLDLNTGFPFVSLPANRFLGYGTMEPLVRYVDSLQPTPVLAERFEFNTDRTKITATLKPGIEFHNGAPVTVEDVFFGIDLLTDPSKFNVNGVFQLTPFAKFIKEKKKLDERTMEFTFDKSRPNMADFFAQLPVSKLSTFDRLRSGQEVNGTGPYKLKSWSAGQGYRLEPHTNWHDKARTGGPYLDSFDVKVFADYDAIGLAFDAGDVELAFEVTGTVGARFRDKKLISIAPRTGLTYVGAVVTNPMLADKRVRQALFLAVDRKRFAEDIGEKLYSITVQPWPKSSPAFDPALEAPFYDPNKAKDLLKQAGFTQTRPLQIEFDSKSNTAYPPVLKDNFEAIGVKIELAPQETAAIAARFRNREFKDFFVNTHAFSDLTPLSTFQQTFPYQLPDAQGRGGNISYYASPEYLDIAAKLESLDPLGPDAKAQYQRFNKMWLDDPWLMPMLEAIRINLVNQKIKGMDKYFVGAASSPDFGAMYKTA